MLKLNTNMLKFKSKDKNMKKQLKSIVEENNPKKLAEYIISGYPIDYTFSRKIDDYPSSLSLLKFLLVNKQYDMVDALLKNAYPNSLTKQTNPTNEKAFLFNIFLDSNAPKNTKTKLYSFFDETTKTDLSRYMSRYSDQTETFSYLQPKEKFQFIIKNDDSQGMIDFLSKNPDFFVKNNVNPLIFALESQAVFCFDIIKDHIKSMKMEAKNNSKPKPF